MGIWFFMVNCNLLISHDFEFIVLKEHYYWQCWLNITTSNSFFVFNCIKRIPPSVRQNAISYHNTIVLIFIWIKLYDFHYIRMLIYTLFFYGSGVVHGNNNVSGTTIFPHNVGLGATRLVLNIDFYLSISNIHPWSSFTIIWMSIPLMLSISQSNLTS